MRVTERVDEHWGLKESDVGWYLLDVVEMKRDKGVGHGVTISSYAYHTWTDPTFSSTNP